MAPGLTETSHLRSEVLLFIFAGTVYAKQRSTSVKLSSELGEITFSTGKQKLTPGEVPTFQGF